MRYGKSFEVVTLYAFAILATRTIGDGPRFPGGGDPQHSTTNDRVDRIRESRVTRMGYVVG